LDIGRQHGRRFVLLRHTHKPQRRPYPICTSRNENARHRCGGGYAGTRLFLGGSFRWVGACVGDENAEPCVDVRPPCIPLVIPHYAARMLLLLLSDELMSCCAAGRNGCLDLRRRASALNGRATAQRSRCPGSVARRAIRQCGSIATKLIKLDACEDWKVVRWCRTQASGYDWHSVVDVGVE